MTQKTLYEKLTEALDYIKNLDKGTLTPGIHEVNDEFYYNYLEYEAKEPTNSIYEAHKNYVDIQYIVEGQEHIDVSFEEYMELDTPYDAEKDIMFFKNPKESFARILGPGEYVIVLPHELHKPGQKVGENGNVKKIVGKVRV